MAAGPDRQRADHRQRLPHRRHGPGGPRQRRARASASASGLGFGASVTVLLQLNTTGSDQVARQLARSARASWSGSTAASRSSASSPAPASSRSAQPAGFELEFGVGFNIGGLSFRRRRRRRRLRRRLRAGARRSAPSADADDVRDRRRRHDPDQHDHSARLGIDADDVHARRQRQGLAAQGAQPRRPPHRRGQRQRLLDAPAPAPAVDFFGIATLSGTSDLDSDGDFDVELNGRMTHRLGRLRAPSATSRIRVTSRRPRTSTAPTTASCSAAAPSVKVRAFGITPGRHRPRASRSASTPRGGATAGSKIELTVRIEVDFVPVLDRRDRHVHDRLPQLPRAGLPPAATASPATSRHWERRRAEPQRRRTHGRCGRRATSGPARPTTRAT